MTSPTQSSQQLGISAGQITLPKLAEIQIDEQTETTIKTLLQYVTVLEQNQVELVRMINTILTELPSKLQQKVDKYMQYYQQNVVDKQLAELDSSVTAMTEIAAKQQKDSTVDIHKLNARIQALEKVYNFDQMSQLFEDVAQIKQMLGQLQNKL